MNVWRVEVGCLKNNSVIRKILNYKVPVSSVLLFSFAIVTIFLFTLSFTKTYPLFENNKKIASEVHTPVSIRTSTTTLYKVLDVVDGDTIKVLVSNEVVTLRLIGLDTPETKDPRKPVQCFGENASKKAKELLSGKFVYLEADPTQGEKDKYNRLLRYVFFEDSTSYNMKMIKDGYAHEYTYKIPYKYQTEYKNAEKYARENNLGFWSKETCNGDTKQEEKNGV